MTNSRVVLLLTLTTLVAPGADIRLGLAGTDTSHVTAFARMLNDTASPHLAEARQIFAFMDAALRSKQSGGKPISLR